MKRIIVPVDFSGESIKALRLAIIYANKFHADLQMVFVQETSNRRFKVEIDREYNTAKSDFENIISKYKKDLHQDCDFSYIIKKGKVYEEIKNQAEAFEDSIIICSTNGESGFSEFFMGSNTYRLIQNTECPVISLTSEKYVGNIERIVLPIDYSKETREKVPFAAKIAKAFGAEIHIVKVTTTTNEAVNNKLKLYAKQVKNYLKEQNIAYQSTLLYGDNITESTIDYAKTIDADLIAIMTEQTKSLSNLLLGSYAHQMLNISPIPVVSITPRQMYHAEGFRTTGG
jgi:nucleotide-binding universal stress UspA family protein